MLLTPLSKETILTLKPGEEYLISDRSSGISIRCKYIGAAIVLGEPAFTFEAPDNVRFDVHVEGRFTISP